MSYQMATTVCNAEAPKVKLIPTTPKFPPNVFSIAIHSKPNGAAVVGFASSSLTTGKAIIIFPIRRDAKRIAMKLHR